jgi:hypothetical protein
MAAWLVVIVLVALIVVFALGARGQELFGSTLTIVIVIIVIKAILKALTKNRY